MLSGDKFNFHKAALVTILILAIITRLVSPLSAGVPKDSDTYIYGGAVVNMLNYGSIPGVLPWSQSLDYSHLESIFFLLFLIPFKLVFSDMNLVLRIVPGVLGALNIGAMYLFTRELTGDKRMALFSSFFLLLSPFHIYRTETANPEGLAIALVLFSLYFLLKNRIVIAGVFGGLIALTDYLILGHYIIILSLYLISDVSWSKAKKVLSVTALTFFIGYPWQRYLNTVTGGTHLFMNNASTTGIAEGTILSPAILADIIYYLPLVVPLVYAPILFFGIYTLRSERYFRFIFIGMLSFFILSLQRVIPSPGFPIRHIVSMPIFVSIFLGSALNKINSKKLFYLIIALSIMTAAASFEDYFVMIPGSTIKTGYWIKDNTPRDSRLSAPSPVYAVFSDRSIEYSNTPCSNPRIDYVVDDPSFSRFPSTFLGLPLNISERWCLEPKYHIRNITVYRVR